MPSLNVHLLPDLVDPAALAGRTVVVVDILRATTTVVHALAAGAREVIPLGDVEEARSRAAALGNQAVLGGERGGRIIEGFDLGNSPLEYTPEKLRGKTLVFTTTNGTRAMNHARQARRILIGAFSNLTALCRELAESAAVDIVCAGTDREITREDVLFAGAVSDELARDSHWDRNDQADLAADAWRSAMHEITSGSPLAAILRASQGARNLIEIGQERDIEIAAMIDRFDIVPELDIAAWRITSGERPA